MQSKVEKVELKTLRVLLQLARYDQRYMDFQLKLPEPNKTGQRLIKEEEDKSMECEFTKINDRCYQINAIGERGVEEYLYDLYQYENGSRAKGVGVLDEEDLYLAPGAKEPARPPIAEKILFRDDERWWKLGLPGFVVYFGHLFGQGLNRIHSDYYDDILFKHNRDLLINPYFPSKVEAALVTYDTQKIDIYFTAEVQPPQTSPITDRHPSMPVLLCRLRQIATGEKKPLAFDLAKDGTIFSDPEHELTNKKRAVKLLQYYWQMGSETAKRILDELKVPRKARSDWIVKKLNEKSGEEPVALTRLPAPSCEPFANVASPKASGQIAANETGVNRSEVKINCQTGLLFPDNLLLDGQGAAKKCAELLTKSTGRPHDVESETENIGDGFPAVVSQTHYRVVEK